MIQVSDETKAAFWNSSINKKLTVVIDGNSIPVENVIHNSVKVKESILESSNIEIGGCIACSLDIELYNREDVEIGQRILVTIQAGDTDEISLFWGFIHSITDTGKPGHISIKAYDRMYELYMTDALDWYNSLTLNRTPYGIMQDFAMEFGINIDWSTVDYHKFDNVIISDFSYKPTSLTAGEVLKSYAELLGVWGIFSREGIFKFINPRAKNFQSEADFVVPYSKSALFDQSDFREYFSYEFLDNEGLNKDSYLEPPLALISGNMFFTQLDWKNVGGAAITGASVYQNLSKHHLVCTAMPWIEVGDFVWFDYYDRGVNYGGEMIMVFNRTMQGIQDITDTITSNLEYIDNDRFMLNSANRLTSLENRIAARPMSQFVTETPDEFEENTIYFVRKS